MNSIIRAFAYRNALKKPAGPFYYLRALSLGRLGVEGVIARIDRLPFAIRPEDYALLVNIFLDECLDAAARKAASEIAVKVCGEAIPKASTPKASAPEGVP